MISEQEFLRIKIQSLNIKSVDIESLASVIFQFEFIAFFSQTLETNQTRI